MAAGSHLVMQCIDDEDEDAIWRINRVAASHELGKNVSFLLFWMPAIALHSSWYARLPGSGKGRKHQGLIARFKGCRHNDYQMVMMIPRMRHRLCIVSHGEGILKYSRYRRR